MPLPLRVQTREGEPAHGLLLRLATRHQDRNVAAFAQAIGLAHLRIRRGHDIGRLADLAGVDGAVLANSTPARETRTRTACLGGEVLYLNDWSTKRRRWCFRCFADDRAQALAQGTRVEFVCWHRGLWDVRSVSACPLHDRVLCETCPRCGKSQSWAEGFVDRCACGGDLAAVPDGLWAHASACSAYIAGRLGFGPRLAVPLVDRLDLKDALTVFERLGSSRDAHGQFYKPRSSAAATANARDEGVRIALGWPTAFEQVLDRLCERASEGVRGMSASYGWVFNEWAKQCDIENFGAALREVIRRHALARGITAPGEPMFAGDPKPSDNITTAARLFGCSHERARELIVANGLMPGAARRGVAVPLPVEKLRAIKAQLDATCGLDGVQRRLGIGKSQTRAVIASGLITPVASAPKPSRYRIEDVDRLVDRVLGVAPVFRCTPPGLATLPDASRAMGIGVHQIVASIFDGAIAVHGRKEGRSGLAQAVVDPSDLKAIRGASEGISVEEAARQIGVHADAARWLVLRGELKKIDGSRRSSVARTAVIEFRSQYIAGAELARRLSRASRTVARLLHDRGVRPKYGPPGCRQLLFDRVAAEAIVAELVATVDADVVDPPGACGSRAV